MSNSDSLQGFGAPPAVVDLRQMLHAVLSAWKVIVFAGFVGAVAGLGYSYSVRPIYAGTVLVSVVSDANSGIGGALGGQLGALASLAGVNIGSAASRRDEYMALLGSKAFARRFVSTGSIAVVISDAIGLPSSASADSEARSDRVVSEEIVEHFTREVLVISEDKKTGLVGISIRWVDPQRAADWANEFVALFNEELRRRAHEDASKKLTYLQAELSKSSTIEVRDSIARLMESAMNQMMLTNVQRDYALRVVDSAVAPPADRPVWPKPALLVAVGVFFGTVIGVFIQLVVSRRRWFISL